MKRILALVLTVVTLASTCNVVYATSNKRQGTNDKWTSAASKKTTDQTLIVGIDEILGTLDPALNVDQGAGHIINNMFEGLMREVNGVIEPAAAKSYSVSEDGKTYTFIIREDAKWSDGKAVTAYDFEYSWDRVVNPETGSEYAWLFDEAKISSWHAIDNSRFEVVLYEQAPYFVGMTAMYTFFPVRKDIVDSSIYADWTAIPDLAVSNGPFRLKDYQYVEKYTFETNPYYWNKEAVKLDSIEWRIIGDEYALLTGYETDNLHIIEDIPSVEIPRLMQEEASFKIVPKDGTYYYNLNTEIKPLNDVRVRKALSLAIDRNLIVEDVLRAGQLPAHSIIPDNYLDANGKVFNQVSGTYDIGYAAKVKEARALLAEAGYPSGKGFPTFEISYNTSEGHRLIGEAVQKMWKDNLGIDVTLANQEWAVFQDSRHRGNFQICRGGWIGDYSDPMTYLDMFRSDAYMNYSNWHNDAFDKLLEESKTLNGQARFDILYKADKMLGDNYLVLPLYHYTDTVLVDEAVVNWEKTSRSLFYFGNTEMVETK